MHGVCDCDDWDDHCATRSPWIRTSYGPPAPAPMAEPIPAPSKLPDGKKGL
jgi:hypothetical protein